MHSLKTLTLLLLLLTPSLCPALLEDEKNNVDVYNRCNPAVVNITATTLRRDFFFDIVPQTGVGSGAIFKASGYIITNHHVVGNAVDVEVTLFDKTQFPARVVGTDPDSDLAVLKINPGNRSLTFLEFGEAEKLAVGQKVLAIGNPFGFGGSLSVGVISSVGRDIRATTNRLIKDVIQTDAAINPGNSGGPLIDSSGKLIGINTQIFSPSGASHGIGFAISLKTVKRIVEQLIQFGQVLRPDLGIEAIGLGEELLRYMGVPVAQGVMVLAIEEGSPAHRAGLRRAYQERIIGFRRIPIGGDVIYQIDETPINTLSDILDYLSDKKVGESITLHYVRGTAKKSVVVTLTGPKARRRSQRL